MVTGWDGHASAITRFGAVAPMAIANPELMAVMNAYRFNMLASLRACDLPLKITSASGAQ
jgi:hypothetical protein